MMKNKNLKKALIKLNDFVEVQNSEDLVQLTQLSANAIKGGLKDFTCGDFNCAGSFTCKTNFSVG